MATKNIGSTPTLISVESSTATITPATVTKPAQKNSLNVIPQKVTQALHANTKTSHISVPDTSQSDCSESESENGSNKASKDNPGEMFLPKYLQQTSKAPTSIMRAHSGSSKKEEELIKRTKIRQAENSPAKTEITPPSSHKRPKINTREH